MAEFGHDTTEQPKPSVDKDIRLRNLKEKQNDERQRKLEEIKAQAFAAQRFKEQKEEERRKRLEELKGREDVRRQQVEERKKAIYQAEQDRLISILKRNQEREARIEAKKRNEKSNVVFAFGSSTPRMLDPTDLSSSFWGHRRATSIQNITCSSTSLTRRQSERDLDSGSKKRAISASGLERSGESSAPLTPAGCASGYVGRRRTDLMPTIPSRDSTFSSTPPRKSQTHSPGRAYSLSRLDQLAKPRKRSGLPALLEYTTSSTTNTSPSYSFRSLSSPRESSVTRSMSHLAVSKTGVQQQSKRTLNKSDSRSLHHLAIDGPTIVPRTTRATQLRQQKFLQSPNYSDASSRPSSSLSQQSTNSVASSVSVRHRPSTTPRRQRPASIAITGITTTSVPDVKQLQQMSECKKGETKPPLPKLRKSISREKPIKYKPSSFDGTPKSLASPVGSPPTNLVVIDKSGDGIDKPMPTVPPDNQDNKHDVEQIIQQIITSVVRQTSQPDDGNGITEGKLVDITQNDEKSASGVSLTKEELLDRKEYNASIEPTEQKYNVEETYDQIVEDIKAITEELIKAQLSELPPPLTVEIKPEHQLVTVQTSQADNNSEPIENKDNEMTTSITKTRITTEEEAKAALAERRRLAREEAERQAEQERLRLEAEAQAELERQKREEEHVQLLIAQQRAAEQERLEEAIKETQRREEEERLRREEEQRLKLIKEEAEKKAREEAERQKAELQERLKNEEKEREARRKRVEAIMLRTRGKNTAQLQQNPDDSNENKSESKMNGTKSSDQDDEGKNGKSEDIVDNNIIADNTVKNANTVSMDSIHSTDRINSNNPWQATQTFDIAREWRTEFEGRSRQRQVQQAWVHRGMNQTQCTQAEEFFCLTMPDPTLPIPPRPPHSEAPRQEDISQPFSYYSSWEELMPLQMQRNREADKVYRDYTYFRSTENLSTERAQIDPQEYQPRAPQPMPAHLRTPITMPQTQTSQFKENRSPQELLQQLPHQYHQQQIQQQLTQQYQQQHLLCPHQQQYHQHPVVQPWAPQPWSTMAESMPEPRVEPTSRISAQESASTQAYLTGFPKMPSPSDFQFSRGRGINPQTGGQKQQRHVNPRHQRGSYTRFTSPRMGANPRMEQSRQQQMTPPRTMVDTRIMEPRTVGRMQAWSVQPATATTTTLTTSTIPLSRPFESTSWQVPLASSWRTVSYASKATTLKPKETKTTDGAQSGTSQEDIRQRRSRQNRRSRAKALRKHQSGEGSNFSDNT